MIREVIPRLTISHNSSTRTEAFVQAQVLKVHADPGIVVPGSQHIDPGRWSPLIYNFRHYYGLGTELGSSFRSQTKRATSHTPN